jgi:hypothetical protein
MPPGLVQDRLNRPGSITDAQRECDFRMSRLARLYHLSVKDLLAGNLSLVDLAVPGDLDHDPPAAMLAALAQRTGVELAQLEAMTLAIRAEARSSAAPFGVAAVPGLLFFLC